MIRTEGQSFGGDPQVLDRLYQPDVPHEVIAPADPFEEHNVHRIRINDVVVRYVEDLNDVVLTVEGSLPAAILDRLVADLQGKLTAIEGTEMTVRRI
jgi:hypothetical protein